MRINIYEEELTAGVSLITKSAAQGTPGTAPETFYGLRFWLESPETILAHSTPEDDDRNAITFWSRLEGEKGLKFLEGVMQRAHSRVSYALIEAGLANVID